MRNDEIVEEVRQRRAALAAQFDYDLEAIAGFLKAEEQRGGHRVVSLPPKKPIPSERKKAI